MYLSDLHNPAAGGSGAGACNPRREKDARRSSRGGERERESARVSVREPGWGWGEGPAWLQAALRSLEERLPREAEDPRRARWQSAVSAAAPGRAGWPEPPREQGCLLRFHGAAGRAKLRSAASLRRCHGLLKAPSPRRHRDPRAAARTRRPARPGVGGGIAGQPRRAERGRRGRGRRGRDRSNARPARAALLPRPGAARLHRAQRRRSVPVRGALQLRRRPSGGLLREGADGRPRGAQRLHPRAVSAGERGSRDGGGG